MRHTDEAEELSHTYSCLEGFEAMAHVRSSQATSAPREPSGNQSNLLHQLSKNITLKNTSIFFQTAKTFLHLTETNKVIIAPY